MLGITYPLRLQALNLHDSPSLSSDATLNPHERTVQTTMNLLKQQVLLPLALGALLTSAIPATANQRGEYTSSPPHTGAVDAKTNDQDRALYASTATGPQSTPAPSPTEASAPSPGVLFQWPTDGPATGGPQLDEPLVTDRPDFTESSVTVGRGVAQIEFGYTFTQNQDNGERTESHSLGEPLLRYGILFEWLELRLGLAPVLERTRGDGNANSTAGTEDLYTGFKIALTPQAGLLPEMAVIPQLNVPTGSNAFTSNRFEPGVNWIYGWEINDFLSTAGSTQANRRIDDEREDYLEVAQSWTLAYGLSDNLGAYTEWYALFPTRGTTAKTEHYFNGGFTWLFTNDVQLDVRAGCGLNSAADDFFVGSGFSIRLQ